jgi:hypothetical protein
MPLSHSRTRGDWRKSGATMIRSEDVAAGCRLDCRIANPWYEFRAAAS